MKLFASKSAPIDPNDMHLSSLIGNNNESMDVNFVGRNNFGNNAYRGNFNPRPFPSNSSNTYGNSTPILVCSLDKFKTASIGVVTKIVPTKKKSHP